MSVSLGLVLTAIGIILSAVFYFLGQKRAKTRHNEEIKKERVDRVDASLVKLLNDKKSELNSVVWIYHLNSQEIDQHIRENIAYVSQKEQRKIDELGEAIQQLSAESEGLEKEIRKFSEQQLYECYTGNEEKSSVVFTPKYLAENMETAFLQILPFEEPDKVMNFTEEFDNEVDLNVKEEEREVFNVSISRGTQGYFDLFEIGKTVQEHQDKYDVDPENLIGEIYSEIYEREKSKKVLAQRKAVIDKLNSLILEFEEKVDKVYDS